MKHVKTILLVALITVFSAFTLVGKGYKVGDIADDFKLKNIDGKMVSLADYTDAKGFIIVFTCNTCPYSVANEDRLNALDAKYKEKGYPVIAINPNNPDVQPGDSFKLMKVRAKEKGFTFPYLFDEGQKVYPKYGATRTPHVYILNKEQEGLRVKYIGAIDDSSRNEAGVKTKYVEDAVDALLSGKELKTTNTRAIGCSIKV
ncbi:MAG: thioredoxin family protein [Flavobacteriaceae bacterium]|nr:thioredoxin family protein [Flavobacteriaceae bacterium]